MKPVLAGSSPVLTDHTTDWFEVAIVDCYTCNGQKTVIVNRSEGQVEENCPTCSGTGKIDDLQD